MLPPSKHDRKKQSDGKGLKISAKIRHTRVRNRHTSVPETDSHNNSTNKKVTPKEGERAAPSRNKLSDTRVSRGAGSVAQSSLEADIAAAAKRAEEKIKAKHIKPRTDLRSGVRGQHWADIFQREWLDVSSITSTSTKTSKC